MMRIGTVVVLGLFITLASLLHGGIYAPGQDFIVNRFTGAVRFVPAEDPEDVHTPIAAARSLTTRRPGARVRRSAAPCGAVEPTRVGR